MTIRALFAAVFTPEGASGIVSPLGDEEIQGSASGSGEYNASVYSDGSINLFMDGNLAAHIDSWYRPHQGGIGTDYYVRLTVLSGFTSTNSFSEGEWISLATNQLWRVQKTGAGTYTTQLKIDIGDSGQNVVSTGTIDYSLVVT